MRVWLLLILGPALFLFPTSAPADLSPPVFTPAAPAPTAEQHYNEGLEHAKRGNWLRATWAYEAAIKRREAFPEAWNGLGYALRQRGKYADAVKAYDRALALRPDYAEALEYLGEAYVRMGKLEEARRILSRLEPLDSDEARKLRAAIEGKK